MELAAISANCIGFCYPLFSEFQSLHNSISTESCRHHEQNSQKSKSVNWLRSDRQSAMLSYAFAVLDKNSDIDDLVTKVRRKRQSSIQNLYGTMRVLDMDQPIGLEEMIMEVVWSSGFKRSFRKITKKNPQLKN